ncbi:MAG: hypothetical protein AAGK14_01485 [Verrucomicrobiota bacterium]
MLSENEVEEVAEIRARHFRMQVFRLSVILVYSLGVIPFAAFLILSAEVWRGNLHEMLPGLALFFGSFAFFVGVILLQSDQFVRDKERLDRLERLYGDQLPWKCASGTESDPVEDLLTPEVTGHEQKPKEAG